MANVDDIRQNKRKNYAYSYKPYAFFTACVCSLDEKKTVGKAVFSLNNIFFNKTPF